ncbi:MAG: LTA synthase family protein [Clostridia bacterium]|nr:LTA synthase family protein [Clostridia bacterium]
MKLKQKVRKAVLAAHILLLLGNFLLLWTVWLLSKYDCVSLDQILYQMKTSAAGTNINLMGSAGIRVGLFGVLLTGMEIFLFYLLSGRLQDRLWNWEKYLAYCKGSVCRFWQKSALPFSILNMAVALVLFITQLNVFGYIGTANTESDFIKTHCIDPQEVQLTFPQTKRNLIYIFLESMENTFAEPEAGGLITDNFIPELSVLAENHVNFSNDEDLGGALSFSGTTWTAAAMVAETSGIVVKVPLTAENYGGEDSYLPGVVSIGELLEKEGYRQTLLVGSDAEFADRESYFTEHGNYEIVDINSLKEQGRLPQDYKEWWGFEDEKLFSFAKEELTRLAESGEPFNFTMLTADTHFPDGYACSLCGSQYEEQYANVLSCSSKQVAALIEWIRQQPFYENTTIVISGDHLTMDPEFLEDIDENYTRTVYNCIINAAAEPAQEKKRSFGVYDMFPTTLAAMGVQIEGDRLGLGTNLFSKEQTLAEQFGFETLNEELQKKSVYYNTRFLGMEE